MGDAENSSQEKDLAWPDLPVAFQHRIAMKWVTLEALRIVCNRCRSQGMEPTVLLLTAQGPIQGTLSDFGPSYEAALGRQGISNLDIASAAVHLRTDLWRMYEAQDPEIAPIDTASVIHVENAVVRLGGRRLQVPHLAVFADDVIAFTVLDKSTVVH